VLSLDISQVLERFPDFRVALVRAENLTIHRDRGPALHAAVEAVEAEVSALVAARPLADIGELQVWRTAYKAFGVKKTSYRGSAERLLKQIQQGRGLPRVNSLVDTYNAISARHRLPIGADDLAKVVGPLAFRYARPGDNFFALGAAQQLDDPPKPGEVVYADAEKILCRRWNWYQDERGATGAATRGAVLTVQCLGGAPILDPAVEALCAGLGEFCGARTAWAVAHAGAPRAQVAAP